MTIEPVPATLISDRIKALQAEARALAGEHAQALAQAMNYARDLAQQIEHGGEAYPAGVRDIARKFALDTEAHIDALQGLVGRLAR